MDNQCCLCGGKEGKEITEGVYACDDCIIGAVYEAYEGRRRKPWYKTKINWGFWVLVVGFLAYLVTWFIIKPMLETGG